LKNSTWIFRESGLFNTSQIIIDSNSGNMLINVPLHTAGQLKSLFFRKIPTISLNIREDTFSMENMSNSKKYHWLKNGTPIGLEYNLEPLIKSQSIIFPRLRGLWKINIIIPDDYDNLLLCLLFLGLFNLINIVKSIYLD
jgi:hypothetical protein